MDKTLWVTISKGQAIAVLERAPSRNGSCHVDRAWGGGLGKPGLEKQTVLKRGDGCLERMWFSRRHVVLVGSLFPKR